MGMARAARLLLHDPGLFVRKSAARISRRMPFFPVRSVRHIRGVRFECDFGLDSRVADMYFAAYEAEEVALLERFLRPGDVFIDVGANIGYLTANGASLVGPGGQVHSFEPVPEYFVRLDSLRAGNPGYAITTNAVALGDKDGTADILTAAAGNIGWNTMVPGFLDGSAARARHTVPVLRLDRYLHDRDITRVGLIKIDTEGFELPVLKGASGFFAATATRPPILCEVAPDAYPLMGTRVADLFDYLARLGYGGREIGPRGRVVQADEIKATVNLLFVADRH